MDQNITYTTGNYFYLDQDDPRVDFVFGNILDQRVVEAALEDVTGVIHLAAASKVRHFVFCLRHWETPGIRIYFLWSVYS